VRRSTTARAAVGAVLILALGLGGLAACSGEGSPEPTPTPTSTAAGGDGPTAEDVAAVDAITVDGDFGSAATMTLPATPFTVTSDVSRLLVEGDGDTIEAGQLLSLHSAWVSGADGSDLGTTYDVGHPEAVTLDPAQLPAVLVDALTGRKVGTRLLLALAGADGATLAVVDVVGAQTLPTKAEGTQVDPVDGLPTVTRDDSGQPTLTAATGDAPTELTVQPLVEGTGPVTEEGQSVVVKYSGWLWDGTSFDSSWENGATFPVAPLGQANVIDGWNQGLVGIPVGSQVLLVIPPELGYGDTEKEGIPAGSTLVFVVDVLAAI